MPYFGRASSANLAECHPALQRVRNEAIKHIDFATIDGERGEAEQEAAKAANNSKAHFGQSAHNYIPSCAIDYIPWPFGGWDDIDAFQAVAAVIKQAADTVQVAITWGGDWHSIKDWGHVELADWKAIHGPLAE